VRGYAKFGDTLPQRKAGTRGVVHCACNVLLDASKTVGERDNA